MKNNNTSSTQNQSIQQQAHKTLSPQDSSRSGNKSGGNSTAIQSSRQQSFQPVLKQKDNTQNSSQQSAQNVQIPTSGAQLRKQGSGPIAQKSQTNSTAQQSQQKVGTQNSTIQIAGNSVIKGQTFNYEDLQKNRSRDNTPNQQQKRQINKNDHGNLANQLEDKVQIIETKKAIVQDQDTISVTESEKNEQRIRPSDEVIQHTETSKDERGSLQPPFVSYDNQKGTIQSFQVIHETQKSDIKFLNRVQQENQETQQFEVIQEEQKDDSQFIYNRDDAIQNSDFKRFNMDEDNQNLRIINNKPSNNFNPNFNPYSFKPSLDLEQSPLTDFQHNYQQQQQNLRYQNNISRTRNDNEFGFQLDESSLKGSTHLFLHSQSNIMVDQTNPSSFVQPHIDLLNGNIQNSNINLPLQSQREQQFNMQLIQPNEAHILSFSQSTPDVFAQNSQNPKNIAEEKQDDNQLLSPTAEMQQRRLNEILKSSQTDTHSLNNSIVQDKMDEKQLNNMIDFEKNFVIMQYESILQQLNVEFQKLISKAKDTDDQLNQKDSVIKTQARILQDKEEQQFQLEQLNRQLNNQVQDLLQELEVLTLKQNQQNQQYQQFNDDQLSSTQRDDTQHRIEKEYLEQKVAQLTSKLNYNEQTERDLRDQLDAAQQKLRISEQKLRVKDEEMFQISRDNTTLQRDVQNMKDIEQQLRQENQQINNQRFQLENDLQDLRLQLSSQLVYSRSKDSEIDQALRENRSLRATIDMQQQNYEEYMQELNNCKGLISDQERAKIQMKGHLDKVNREHSQMETEVHQLKNQLDSERSRALDMENHFKQEIQKLMNQNKQLQSNINSLNERQIQNENINQRPWENTNKKKISFDDEVQYKQGNNESLNNSMYQKNQNEQSRPLQETHNTFYSPQRNQRNTISYQQPSSPKFDQQKQFYKDQNQVQNQQKSTISWPNIWGSQNQNNQNNINIERQNNYKEYPPPKNQSLTFSNYNNQNDKNFNSQSTNQSSFKRDQDGLSLGRRGTIQNQNESQLHNVLSWDQNQGQHQHHLSVGSRSLERPRDPNASMKNSRSEKKFDNNQSSSFQNSNKSLNSQQESSIPWLSSGQQQNTQQKQASTFNQFRPQQQYQDQDLQPAGKKSTIKQFQSPLGRKDKNVDSQINHLQNSLSSLQIDKERVENDYRKIGHPKNKQQIERKQELEFEVEIIAKNIQNIKQKLRELNAFQQ